MLFRSGDDHLIGFQSNDVFDGGLGNDRLEGGDGSDTYIFDIGDGNDVIHDRVRFITYSDNDKFQFGASVLLADTVFSRSGEDLIVTFAGSSDSLTIESHFNGLGYDRIETFEFSDGAILTSDDITILVITNGATPGDDIIIGTSDANFIDGGAGNDTLIGEGGEDTLVGGLGNDSLNGGGGSDIYIFTRGDGQDEIEDRGWSNSDRLIIHGYAPEEVLVQRGSDTVDLLLTFVGTSDSITILNTLEDNSLDTIEEIVFDDGTVWTPAALRLRIIDESQTDGDDVIVGFDTNDQLEGGLGNDELRGNNGSDSYIFTRGDGQDEIEDSGYEDTDRLIIHGYTPDRSEERV